MNGVLYKTKCYLVGAIESDSNLGVDWRKRIERALNKLGIICFNPNSKPFIKDFSETKEKQAEMARLRKHREYERLSNIMREIRIYDLNLVDRSDFLIVYLDLNHYTVGSFEEIFSANKQKKVIFLIIKQGKDKCPFWLFGTIPHKYIYGSIGSVIKMIKNIDSGKVEIDSSRWRLLKQEYR